MTNNECMRELRAAHERIEHLVSRCIESESRAKREQKAGDNLVISKADQVLKRGEENDKLRAENKEMYETIKLCFKKIRADARSLTLLCNDSKDSDKFAKIAEKFIENPKLPIIDTL